MNKKILKITVIIAITILFACNKDKKEITENKKVQWIENAFVSLESNNYPKIKAISWWHENFDNSLLKVNSSNESLEAYKKGVNSSTFVTSSNIIANL